MEIRGVKICGHRAIAIRNALHAFCKQPSRLDCSRDIPTLVSKKLTDSFIRRYMKLTAKEARRVLECLVSSGYVDPDKRTPTSRGMALVNAKARAPLPFERAKAILSRFLDAVVAANRRTRARVFVESVSVFGSYERSAEKVGDIDLLVIVTIPEDVQPEDIAERDRLIARLQISRYLSLHDQFDPVATSAKSRRVYERAAH
jgi:predicted nucleotidyltransferase